MSKLIEERKPYRLTMRQAWRMRCALHDLYLGAVAVAAFFAWLWVWGVLDV